MSVLEKFRLDGKVAVITGAGKGIGAEIARTFAQAGADIVLAARTEADLNKVAKEVQDAGSRALVVPTDVLDFSDLQKLVDKTMA